MGPKMSNQIRCVHVEVTAQFFPLPDNRMVVFRASDGIVHRFQRCTTTEKWLRHELLQLAALHRDDSDRRVGLSADVPHHMDDIEAKLSIRASER